MAEATAEEVDGSISKTAENSAILLHKFDAIRLSETVFLAS